MDNSTASSSPIGFFFLFGVAACFPWILIGLILLVGAGLLVQAAIAKMRSK